MLRFSDGSLPPSSCFATAPCRLIFNYAMRKRVLEHSRSRAGQIVAHRELGFQEKSEQLPTAEVHVVWQKMFVSFFDVDFRCCLFALLCTCNLALLELWNWQSRGGLCSSFKELFTSHGCGTFEINHKGQFLFSLTRCGSGRCGSHIYVWQWLSILVQLRSSLGLPRRTLLSFQCSGPAQFFRYPSSK